MEILNFTSTTEAINTISEMLEVKNISTDFAMCDKCLVSDG